MKKEMIERLRRLLTENKGCVWRTHIETGHCDTTIKKYGGDIINKFRNNRGGCE